MGRPTDCTPEVQAKIIQALLAGNYFEVACRYAGVSPESGYSWMRRGEGRDRRRERSQVYVQFAHAIRAAEAEMEARIVAQIQQALPGEPKDAMTFLARRFPDRWANRDKLDVNGKLDLKLTTLTDEELDALDRIARKAAG